MCSSDKHDDAAEHPPATTATATSTAAPAASNPAAATAAVPANINTLPSPTKDNLHPAPLPSPLTPATSALAALSPSTHTSPVISPAASSSQPSPHPSIESINQKDFPSLLAHCQKLIQTFLSKHRSHPSEQPSTLPVELLTSLKQLTANAAFDATKLGADGPKLVGKLSELCAKCVKDFVGHGHGSEVMRSTSALYEAMSAPHHEMHDMTGFSAVKALFHLFTGPSTAKSQSSSSSNRIVTPPFSSGHNSAIKAHLPTTLVDVILANANVQVTVNGQTLATVAGAALKKQPSVSTALQAVAASLHPPAFAKSSSLPTVPKASSTLSDCEYHSFTLLAILCSHDHTAIEDMISHHKLDTLLLLSSVQGPTAYALSPITSVFHSNLLKLLKCVSKGQKLVKGVSKAMHDTAVIKQLLEVLRRGPDSDTLADSGQTASSSYQVAFDCFDLLTMFVLDSFPHAPVVFGDFEAHDGNAAILAFLLRYCRRLDRINQPKLVARRLAALVSVGYVKLEVEHDVLPFNLPPSSRTSAAHSLLPPVPAPSPSAKVYLSTALSINPSLPETHSHAIGQLPTTPSIARMRGHARINSASLSPTSLSAATNPFAATAATSTATSNPPPAARPAPASITIRNLEAVQLIRDVFMQCSSSSLRLHLLQSLEFVFTSASQLHTVSSTGLTARLLQLLPSFSTPVQHSLLNCLQLIISHCHNDYIPFKELCALNVTLTAELIPSSLSSVQSVLISLDRMLEYDQLRYQHLLREAGVLDVMVTNITQWYALFAIAFEERYDPISSSHTAEREATAAFRRAGAFSPRAEALTSIRLEVKKRREMGTPSASPSSDVRRRLDVDEHRDGDSPQPSPAAASQYGRHLHSRNTSASVSFLLPIIPDSTTPHHLAPSSASSLSFSSSSSLSVTHLVRVVTAGMDVLTVLLRDSSINQELFSTTTGPAVLLSFTVYPPTATKALHLVEMLLQAHYTRLEAMLAPPAGTGRDKKSELDKEADSVALGRSNSLEGIMTGSSAPKTVQALQLLGDAYMLALLHLLFSSLPAIAFELPFYRTPPSDPVLLLKPSNLSLATHPKLRSFFPLPIATSAIDTNSILRVGRLLHLIRRALSSSYYGQQSFGRMRGFERVACLMKGLSVRQIQITRGEAILSRQHSASSNDGERPSSGSGATMVSQVPPSASPTPPSTSHSAVLFLLQEVMLTFILALKGNERNSHYSYPRPLPSHYHLSDVRHTVGFHTVGYRRLARYLLKCGVLCGEDGNSWSVCADLVCNWLFWLSLEYLPSDHELISTPSLPCALNTLQLEQQLDAEMKEEQAMITIALNEQTINTPPPVASPRLAPPTGSGTQHASGVPSLRVNTEDQSASTWPCWWEEQEATIEFTPVPVHKLVLLSPGTVYHPLALRLVARFLHYSTHHLQRRLLVLVTLLVKNNALNAIALGQADVLAPLITFFRPVLNQPLDVRHQLMLDVVQLLLPFTPHAGSMHALFGIFDQPSRFPASLLSWLTDVATRSVPMPYMLLDGKEAGMRVASINNSKWPPSNGYTVAAWVFIEPNAMSGLARNNSSGDLTGRKSPSLSTNLPPTHHRHHLSVQVGTSSEAESPISPKRPVRKMSAQFPSHALPPTAPTKPPTLTAPPSPSLPPSSPSPISPQPSASLTPFSLLRIESEDGKSVFSLVFHPLSGQLTLKTAARSSHAFPGVKLQPGRWHHIAITHSSSFIQGSWCHLYINGVHQVESKVPYINKGGSAANIGAYMGGSVSGQSSSSIDLGLPPIQLPALEQSKHVSRPSAGSLQVPGERSRSNSVSAAPPTRENDSPPGTPNPSLSLSATATTGAPFGSSTTSTSSSPLASRWRLASCLLLDDVLPDVVVRSLYELGPRTSAIVHAASRPTVVDTLASVYPASRALNHALDNIPLLVPKVSRRAQWTVVNPQEEAAAAALSKRSVGALLELDQSSRMRSTASPTESAGKSVTSVVAYERIIFFFHASNGQDVASAVHTTSIDPKQMDFRIDNSGPPTITSDARLIAPATVVQPRAVVDRMKQIGGMRRLLALVDKCGASRDDGGPDAPGMALRQALLLISQAVRRHPSNHRDMQDIDGYKLLGHLLKQISVRSKQQTAQSPHPTQQAMRRGSLASPFPIRTPSPVPPASSMYTPTSSESVRELNTSTTSPLMHPQSLPATAVATCLLDCVAVEILFSLVGLSDSGAAGVISNNAALDYLILDFHIWRDCPVEVQLYLFQCLFNCICTSTAREENITALRESRVVGWLVSLASDVSLHTDVLNCCVSIVRELMLHQLIDHELHIVADFAATSIMTDTRSDALQQQATSARRSSILTRRSSMDAGGVTVLSSDESYPHEMPPTPVSQIRRFGDDSQPVGSPPVVSGTDSSFKVYIGSRHAARVNSLFIEMMLDVLLRIRSSPKQLATFFKRIDFNWLFCVLHSGDPQATYQPPQQQNRHRRRGSLGRASVLHHKQGQTASGEVQSAAILALKILMVLLQDSHLFNKFKSSPGFSSLPPLLLPHCYHGQVFSILLCAMLGKSVLDVPTAALDINAIGSAESWSSLLNSAANVEGEGGVVVPELVPVVIALLRECIELTKHHQASAATAAAAAAVTLSPQPSAPSNLADVSRPISPARSSVVLDQLETLGSHASSGILTAEVVQQEALEDEGVIVDLSADQSLEFSDIPRAAPLSVRHQRTLTTLEAAAQVRSPVSVDVSSPAHSLSLRTPTHRSPSRRSTFNPHESGNVAATVQAKRKKGHGRSGSLHMYELFSPSNELLKAAGGADSSANEVKEPRSPMSARLADYLATKAEDADGRRSPATEETAGAATVAPANGVESSPSRRTARHRTMLTISTTGPSPLSADSTPATQSRPLTREAKEAASEAEEPASAQFVITHPDDATADTNSGAAESIPSSRPITPIVSSRPITPVTPTTPEAVHTTTGLKALRTIKNKEVFHTIAHYGSHQRAHHHANSTSVSSAYARHYHSHIVHQPDIKAMNGTITFMTRLFNVSDAFRTLACKQAFMRQLISAVFASATMGIVQPQAASALGPPQPQRSSSGSEENRRASPTVFSAVERTSISGSTAQSVLYADEKAFVSDDPSIPTAPAIDLRKYIVDASEPNSPLSMSRQSSEERYLSPSPSASSTSSTRRVGERNLSITRLSDSTPRARKSSLVVASAAQPTVSEQPIRGILANIDTADLFRHSTSVLLFQLLRQIVVQNLLTRTKGTQMLIDCLDQAPANSNLQQRIRYQTTLLAGLSARLEERLSGGVMLNNSKLAYTVDRLGQLFVERLEQGMFLNGGPSTFQFILHILLLPECRQLVDDTLQGDKDKATARASLAGMRLIRPLYDILNQVILAMCEGFSNGEVTAADLMQLNETLLQHAPLLFGEHNSARTLIACLCHHLYKQMSATDDEVSGSAIRLWSWFMKNKLETMMELLRANIREEVQTALVSRTNSSSQLSGADFNAPMSPPPAAESIPSAPVEPPSPPSTSGRQNVFVPPPITRKRLVDLLDDDGKGGFDQLMQATTGTQSDTTEPHWMTEFRMWLRSNDKRILAVFAVTLQPQWSAYIAAQKREQSHSWNKQQAHVIQDMGRHRQEEQDRLKKAAQMEVTILSKLQTTSNVEIQRLLRRDQRLTEIDKQANRAWCKVREAMTAAQLMYDHVEHKLPPTQERLRRMREEVASKRSWQMMMEHDDAVVDDDWRMTGDDNSVYIDEWEASAATDSSLVFRQPWRVEPSEGPARVRRRLCSPVMMRPDAPLFSHPYRLWEEERRSSITEERDKNVDGAESDAGAETDVEESQETETIEMDVTVDTRDGEVQEADFSDEQKLADLPTATVQPVARDDETEESKEAETSESAATQVSLDDSGIRRASVTITADGDIIDTDGINFRSSTSSPRQPVRSPLRVDTRRAGSVARPQPAAPDGSTPSPHQLTVDAATSPALQRLRTGSMSASPRSGPRSGRRHLAMTATSSDSIPAVAAEPRRRKRLGVAEGEDDSPRTPQSASNQAGSLANEVADNTTSSSAGTVGDTLPLAVPLMPIQSAPVYSASTSLDSSNLDISIVAPSEAETESKPPSPPLQSQSEFTSPEQNSRRAASRPRSLTAEDAALQSLGLPAGQPSLQMSRSTEALRPETAGSSPQPLTPSVPLPGSQDDDEGAEADDLLFLEEDKLKLLMDGDEIRQRATRSHIPALLACCVWYGHHSPVDPFLLCAALCVARLSLELCACVRYGGDTRHTVSVRAVHLCRGRVRDQPGR